MYIIIFDNNKWNHLPRWICKHTHATPFFKEWQTVSKLKTCHQECALKKLKIGSNVNQEENTEHSLHIWELKLNKWKCTLYLNMIGKLTLLMMVLFLRILTLILVNQYINKIIIIDFIIYFYLNFFRLIILFIIQFIYIHKYTKT